MPTLSHAEMIDRVKAMYGAILALDEARMAELTTPGFALIESDCLPYRGSFEGPSGVKRLITDFSEKYFGTWGIEVTDFTVSDSRVVAHLHFTTTGKTTGKGFSMAVLEVWKFEGDKLAEMRPFYWDGKLAGEVAG
jgi:uncharacterized protein